jgi:pilus assembly protein CpaF
VVQVARLSGGVRRIIKISEITGMEGEIMSMQDLFGFKQTGVDEKRVAQGYFFSSGIRPNCLEKLEVSGNKLPVEMFERRILNA